MVDPEAPLATPRLLLEPLQVAHAPSLFAHLRDERLYAFIPQDPPSSLAAVEARYRALARRRSPDGRETWLNWVAKLRSGDQSVGTIEATVRADGTALLACMTFAPFQHRGYAREGCTRVLDHLFADHGVAVVIAEIDTRNTASIALVERLGFARVATTRDVDFFKGTASDEHRYERQAPAHRVRGKAEA